MYTFTEERAGHGGFQERGPWAKPRERSLGKAKGASLLGFAGSELAALRGEKTPKRARFPEKKEFFRKKNSLRRPPAAGANCQALGSPEQ